MLKPSSFHVNWPVVSTCNTVKVPPAYIQYMYLLFGLDHVQFVAARLCHRTEVSWHNHMYEGMVFFQDLVACQKLPQHH